MARRADPFGPGLMYCVTQHATGQELFFRDDYDRLGFESTLVRTLKRYEIELVDYCLMSNHYHLFMLLSKPNLAVAMQYLAARYVTRYNLRYDRRGHFVQAPYWSEPVLTEGHYWMVRRYFAMNPIKAGICDRPEEWAWGGYGGRGRIAPAPDAVLRRLVAHELAEWRRQRAAATTPAPSGGHARIGHVLGFKPGVGGSSG